MSLHRTARLASHSASTPAVTATTQRCACAGHPGDHGEPDGQRQEEARHPHGSNSSAQVEERRVERELLDTHVVRGELRQQLVVRGP